MISAVEENETLGFVILYYHCLVAERILLCLRLLSSHHVYAKVAGYLHSGTVCLVLRVVERWEIWFTERSCAHNFLCPLCKTR